MKLIPLTKGHFAQVDDEDYDRVIQHCWIHSENGYAMGRVGDAHAYLHKFVMNCTDDVQVDHRDRDRLNCQKDNLRPATTQQNNCNAPKPQTENGTGYRGVDRRESGRFRASIRVDYKKIALGTYDDAVSAAKAYDAGAKRYHGEFALLNFPEEVHDSI